MRKLSLLVLVFSAAACSVSVSRPPAVPGPARTPQRAADGLLRVDTEAYELYAPTERDLSEGRTDLEHAASQFRRYFGTVPKIAVVLLSDPEQFSTFDPAPFEARGLAALPMLTTEGLSAAVASRVRAVGELATILVADPTTGSVVVRAVIQLAKPAGVDLREGDTLRALNGQPIPSLRVWEEQWSAVSTGARVVVEGRRAGQPFRTEFARPESNKMSLSTPSRAAEDPIAEARVLSHEVCHMFLIAHLNQRLGRTRAQVAEASQTARAHSGGSYGDPMLPDWFDEATATLCETPTLQQKRRAYAREHRAEMIPLAQLFAMPHPNVAGRTGTEAASGTRVTVEVGGQGAPQDHMFYPQVLTLAQFLAEREGPEFIGRVAENLARGRSMPEILRGARNLPADLDSLQRAYAAWLATAR
jgi:hypothetical protein